MANPKIVEVGKATQFKAGHPGRAEMTHSKGRLTATFLRDFLADFQAHGKETIERVRIEEPGTYIKVAAAFVPKEIEVTRPLGEMSEDELTSIVDAIRQTLGSAQGAGSGTGTEAVGEPDPALSAVH